MNYRIDNLQYCNWSREVFQINRGAGLDAVHVTLVYHEDFDEFLIRIKNGTNILKKILILFFKEKTIMISKKQKQKIKQLFFLDFKIVHQ